METPRFWYYQKYLPKHVFGIFKNQYNRILCSQFLFLGLTFYFYWIQFWKVLCNQSMMRDNLMTHIWKPLWLYWRNNINRKLDEDCYPGAPQSLKHRITETRPQSSWTKTLCIVKPSHYTLGQSQSHYTNVEKVSLMMSLGMVLALFCRLQTTSICRDQVMIIQRWLNYDRVMLNTTVDSFNRVGGQITNGCQRRKSSRHINQIPLVHQNVLGLRSERGNAICLPMLQDPLDPVELGAIGKVGLVGDDKCEREEGGDGSRLFCPSHTFKFKLKCEGCILYIV